MLEARDLFAPALALVLATATTPASAMNLVRTETGVEAALAKYDVRGRNVIVAVLDRGIDWRNPDFRNANGTTRIEYIFDLTDNTGANAPGNTYGKGTIYTQAQINSALTGGPTLNTRDAVGHGCTTTGIAAGGGRNDPAYSGIAPEARLIIIKLTSDGAPAHDGQPAEAAFYDPTLIPVAIDFARDKAAELALPCVMILNIGSVGGPTDGTSKLARKIDQTVGAGKPGLVFVTGTSDDGGATNRASGTVAQGQKVSLQVEKNQTGTLTFDLWYPETDRFRVRIITPGGTMGPFEAPAGPANSSTANQFSTLYYHLGRDVDFSEATNQKREIWVRMTGVVGTYTIELEGVTVVDGHFDATLNPSRFNSAGSPINQFLNFTAPGSIWDLAAATNNLCPNSYMIRTNWVDVDNFPRSIGNQGAIGDLWNGSGVGPTFDGRLGVDVSAPGDSLFTTYGTNTYWATIRFNTLQGSGGKIGRASAVSAANPIITGIVALLLEMDPTLDAVQIRQILRDTARRDAFTGANPNARWGYGKVNALAALDRVHADLTRLQLSRPNPAALRISARGQPGKDYVLQGSTDFQGWSGVWTNTATVAPFDTDVPTTLPWQWFRLKR